MGPSLVLALAAALLVCCAGPAAAAQKKGKPKKGNQNKKKGKTPPKKGKGKGGKAKTPKKPTPPKGRPRGGSGTVKADEPQIDAWDETNLADKGRIVGSLTHCPGCQIEVLSANVETLEMLSVKAGDPDYCIEWLDASTYSLRITGGGATLVVPNVTVEAMSDTRVDIHFPRGSVAGAAVARTVAPTIERWPTWYPPRESMTRFPGLKVPNFKPKSFREIDRQFRVGPASGGPANGRRNRGKGKKGRGKGKRKGKGRKNRR